MAKNHEDPFIKSGRVTAGTSRTQTIAATLASGGSRKGFADKGENIYSMFDRMTRTYLQCHRVSLVVARNDTLQVVRELGLAGTLRTEVKRSSKVSEYISRFKITVGVISKRYSLVKRSFFVPLGWRHIPK